MSRKIGWGIIGAGAIANAFADGVVRSRTGRLVAIGSRTRGKADAFAEKWGGIKAHGSYEALLADSEVDAVYVATPHPQHPEWAIRAAEAGKHLLVEKPLAINAYLAETVIEAAVRNNVFLMEAYMYRCHPQTGALLDILKRGLIGDVSMIQAAFAFQAGFNPDSRVWSNALAGGGILDVGGYTTSVAGLIAGATLGKSFAEPASLVAVGELNPETGVDSWSSAVAKFENGIVAALSTGVGVKLDNEVRVYGSGGSLVIPNPYVAARGGAAHGGIILRVNGEEERVIEVRSELTSYVFEVDACGEAILAGEKQASSPAMRWEDSLANLRMQDRWRQSIGLEYDSEKPEALGRLSPAGWPLLERRASLARPGGVKGLDKRLSRLVMGVDNQNTAPHAEALFDDYFMRGGNVFDTAFVYGENRSRLLGAWIRARDVADESVVIIKGAHTPNCLPEPLESQVNAQLEWLGLEGADIYMMHRDNTEVPVGEFVDVMNRLADKGCFKAFGVSNWTLERVRAANEYAAAKGLRGLSVLSNHLSLAEMVNPVWSGCLDARSAEFQLYLEESGMALLPWSSQARGFFAPGRAHPDSTEDASLARSFYSSDNFRRLERATELADARGRSPVEVALAWVLRRPFEVFPLIGPRHIAETRGSFSALDLALTEEECRYLDLDG